MIVRPVRFLLGVALAWAVARALWLWPQTPDRSPRPVPRWAPPLPHVPVRPGPRASPPLVRTSAPAAHAVRPRPAPALLAPTIAAAQPQPDLAAPAAEASPVGRARVAALSTAARPRLGLSAWALVRPSGGSAGLVPAGQLGASQAGVRGTFPLGGGLAAAARLSAPIAARRGKEAALALDWRPLAGIPVTISVERRIGIDDGGRDAWGFGAFGGASDVRLVGRAMVDVYAQAGIVGRRRRDAYADGALRVAHPIGSQGFAGAGLWAAAQPGIARLDVGPLLGARIGRARLSLEWRARIAGEALPASGPALSLGADF